MRRGQALIDTLRARPWGFAAVIAIALLIANVVARSSFATPSSWPATLATFAPFALAAMASTPQILSGAGNIDISIGPLLNLINIVIVAVLIPHGLGSPWVAVPIALGIGAVVGAINGVLVAGMRFQAVLATLCTLFVLEGVAQKILPNPTTGTASWLAHLGNKVGPIPGALILIVVPFLLWFALGRTAYLRTLFSVGGDDAASFSAGVNVTAVRVIAFTLGGVLAGVAGIALAAATQSGDASQAIQYTLPALAAVAIGGTSLLGGRGSLIGSVAGAAIMFLIQTLLDSLAVSDLWLQVVYGMLLLLAIVFSSMLAAPRAVKARTA
ncbi:MAG: ABC transporter permease [Solirubrobacterales bacterium]|nr:ABC transporter permease [Solirubrobacterales bacterium]MBV9800419.1 ABC transporter permease [Solirubrobacterales bacterium]